MRLLDNVEVKNQIQGSDCHNKQAYPDAKSAIISKKRKRGPCESRINKVCYISEKNPYRGGEDD